MQHVVLRSINGTPLEKPLEFDFAAMPNPADTEETIFRNRYMPLIRSIAAQYLGQVRAELIELDDFDIDDIDYPREPQPE